MCIHSTRISPEEHARLSAAAKKRWQSEAYRRAHDGCRIGLRHSQETKQKIRAKALGRHPTAEARAKMSATRRGRKFTEEQKARLRAGLARMSPEARARRCAHRCGPDNPMFGRHHSEERKAQMSAKMKAYRKADAHIAATIRNAGKRPNKAESKLAQILDAAFPAQWRYVGNGDLIVGGKNPDFVNVNGKKAVIELFGDYWHSERATGKPEHESVASRIQHFAAYGLECLVVWERELRDPDRIRDAVTALGAK